jgi:hypothetical protein
MSLPFFKGFNWEAEVVAIDPIFVDMVKDDLLLESIPAFVKIHKVKAFEKKWTSKFGLGSVALRSLWYYWFSVNKLLKSKKFDLVYFSTTQFPVCILGPYCKYIFKIPYVIDMQDPWHSIYYQDKPKAQRPKKYWFSYNLNKFLEPIALKQVDGLISVSQDYLLDLLDRYPKLKKIPSSVITFGAFEPDFQIALNNASRFKPLLDPGTINLVYIGRGGNDMHKAVELLFQSFKKGIDFDYASFKKIKLYFIGTSYANAGEGETTITPLAEYYGIRNFVIEMPDRIGYYHTLFTLTQADALFIPGSDDPKYTASKIYPYLLANKPLLTIFHEKSSANRVLTDCVENVYMCTFPSKDQLIPDTIHDFLRKMVNLDLCKTKLTSEFAQHSAYAMTYAQSVIFDKVISTS